MRWIEADVTGEWTVPRVDIWHDRAVFHFLTDPEDRVRYRERLFQGLRPGGSAVIATFGPHGPLTCSGLRTARYAPEQLAAELGGAFRLRETVRELHRRRPARRRNSVVMPVHARMVTPGTVAHPET